MPSIYGDFLQIRVSLQATESNSDYYCFPDQRIPTSMPKQKLNDFALSLETFSQFVPLNCLNVLNTSIYSGEAVEILEFGCSVGEQFIFSLGIVPT